MTDAKRLQDQMQAHEDARTTPHGFTGADLSDFQAPEAPVGEVAAERLSESLTVSGPWADAFVRLIEAVQAPVIERAERAEAAWEKWQDRAAERDTSAGLREALERLLEFPNWTYIDGELTAVLLPNRLRAVLAAHPASEPAADPGVDVVEQVAQTISGNVYGPSAALEVCRRIARALADAGLLADPEVSERAEWLPRVQRDLDGMRLLRDEAVGERDRARAIAVALEQENALLSEDKNGLRAQVEQWRQREWSSVRERMVWRHENGEHQSDRPFQHCPLCRAEVAESRARRAEDALRAVRVEVAATRRRLLKSVEDAIDNDPVVALVVGPHVTNIMDAFCERLDQSLSGADQSSDATPSDTTTEEDA